jgi:hypothetical protein
MPESFQDARRKALLAVSLRRVPDHPFFLAQLLFQ